MNQARSATLRSVFSVALALLAVASAWLAIDDRAASALLGRPQSLVIDPTSIHAAPDGTFSFVMPRRTRTQFLLLADDPYHPARSQVRLFEDERPLGPAHAAPEDLRRRRGAYSHYERELHFSTSDGTDPRRNGRRYRIEGTDHPAAGFVSGLQALAVAAALGLLALQARRLLAFARSPRARHGANAILGIAIAATVLPLLDDDVASSMLGRSYSFRLEAASFAPEKGAAYLVSVPRQPRRGFWIAHDGPGNPTRSNVRLLEDGRALGPAHALPDQVREGKGAYSDWDGVFALSASDGSDPRSNGRDYRIEGVDHPSPGAVGKLRMAALACALLLALLNRRALARRWPLVAQPLLAGRAGTGIASLFGAMAGATAVWWNWHRGISPDFSIFGLVPMSDAVGWWNCAMEFAMGTSVGQFCQLRTLYSAWASPLFALSRGHGEVMLLLQGALVGLCIGALWRAADRSLGFVAGLVVATGTYAYARDHAFGVYMTEALGTAAGAVAASYLLVAAPGRREGAIACAMLSVAMFARFGALFSVPLLFLALLPYDDWRSGRRRSFLASAALLAAACGAGFALHALIVKATGGTLAHTASQYPQTLYGLVQGSRDWTQIQRDHPEVFNSPLTGPEIAAEIYRICLDRFFDSPLTLARSLVLAWGTYYEALFSFTDARWLKQLLFVGYVGGVAVLLVRRRQAPYRALLAVAVGEWLSAPWFIDAGGPRLLAGTVAARLCVVGVGVAWVAQRSSAWRSSTAPVPDPPLCAPSWPALAIVLPMLAAILPLGRVTGIAPVAGPACPQGHERWIFDLERASHAISFEADRPERLALPYAATRRAIVRSFGGRWYEELFASAPEGATLVLGANLAPESFGKLHLLYAPPESRSAASGLHIGCVDPADTRMWGGSFRHVVNWRPALGAR